MKCLEKFQETLARERVGRVRGWLKKKSGGHSRTWRNKLTRVWTCVGFGCILRFKTQILITFQYESEAKSQCTLSACAFMPCFVGWAMVEWNSEIPQLQFWNSVGFLEVTPINSKLGPLTTNPRQSSVKMVFLLQTFRPPLVWFAGPKMIKLCEYGSFPIGSMCGW